MDDVIADVWEDDGLDILVDVEFEDGSAITSLTGGTAAVFVQQTSGGAVILGTATIESSSVIRAVYAPGTLAAGTYDIQVKATVGGVPRTVRADTFVVKPSLHL